MFNFLTLFLSLFTAFQANSLILCTLCFWHAYWFLKGNIYNHVEKLLKNSNP